MGYGLRKTGKIDYSEDDYSEEEHLRKTGKNIREINIVTATVPCSPLETQN